VCTVIPFGLTELVEERAGQAGLVEQRGDRIDHQARARQRHCGSSRASAAQHSSHHTPAQGAAARGQATDAATVFGLCLRPGKAVAGCAVRRRPAVM
jgi:hypothetical protein